MHITSCSRDSRETLKYGTFGRKKFGFRAMSRRILKLCVASLLNILCFPVEEMIMIQICFADISRRGRQPSTQYRWQLILCHRLACLQLMLIVIFNIIMIRSKQDRLRMTTACKSSSLASTSPWASPYSSPPSSSSP